MPVLPPLYQFSSETTFPLSDEGQQVASITNDKEQTVKKSNDLPEQYKNVAFAKSVREKFAQKVPNENNVDYVEEILFNKVHRHQKQTERETATRKSRRETIQKFLSYKKGIRVTCEICHESFADKKSLLRHKVCRHEKFSPHQCPICKKMFYKPGDVRRHVVIHAESRGYCCNFCQKTYKTNNHLQRHVKLKHKSEIPNTTPDVAVTEKTDEENIEVAVTRVNSEKEKLQGSNILTETITEINDNDPVLETVPAIGTSNMLLSDTSTLLNNTAALLNGTNSILQNHSNLNDHFFRSDVQMCLMERGFF